MHYSGKLSVAAAEEQQWCPAIGVVHAGNPAYDNQVIAAVMGLVQFTLESRQGAGNQRRTVFSRGVVRGVQFVIALPRVAPGKVLLMSETIVVA